MSNVGHTAETIMGKNMRMPFSTRLETIISSRYITATLPVLEKKKSGLLHHIKNQIGPLKPRYYYWANTLVQCIGNQMSVAEAATSYITLGCHAHSSLKLQASILALTVAATLQSDKLHLKRRIFMHTNDMPRTTNLHNHKLVDWKRWQQPELTSMHFVLFSVVLAQSIKICMHRNETVRTTY